MVRAWLVMLWFGGQMAHPAGFLQKTIEHDGATAKYVVYVPSTYDPKKPMPTILFLHGMGERGSDGWKQVPVGLGSAIMMNSEAWNFIVIFPQKSMASTKWMDQEKEILAIVEKTKKEYNVDSARLYLTGLSMGGFGTWLLAAKHPEMFAAIAPICGGGNPADAAALKDIPTWCFHGDKDNAVPLDRSREMIEAIKAAGGNPQFTVYPGVGHNSWDKAYRDEKLWEWFLKHSKK